MPESSLQGMKTWPFIHPGPTGPQPRPQTPSVSLIPSHGNLGAVGAKTANFEPGSPWENGYIESFHARFRDELLDGEIFYTLREAQVVIGEWRRHYNTVRPHSAIGWRPPLAPESFIPVDHRPTMH